MVDHSCLDGVRIGWATLQRLYVVRGDGDSEVPADKVSVAFSWDLVHENLPAAFGEVDVDAGFQDIPAGDVGLHGDEGLAPVDEGLDFVGAEGMGGSNKAGGFQEVGLALAVGTGDELLVALQLESGGFDITEIV